MPPIRPGRTRRLLRGTGTSQHQTRPHLSTELVCTSDFESRVSQSILGLHLMAIEVVFKTLDIVLAKISAGLHLNHFQRLKA